MLQFITTNAERRVEKRLTLLVGLIERGFAWRALQKFYLGARQRELKVLKLGRVRMMRKKLRRMGWSLNLSATDFQ